jgi:hypothetical protein
MMSVEWEGDHELFDCQVNYGFDMAAQLGNMLLVRLSKSRAIQARPIGNELRPLSRQER